MDPLIAVMAAGLVASMPIGFVLFSADSRRRAQVAAWSDAAAHNGLEHMNVSMGGLFGPGGPVLTKRAGKLRVRLTLRWRGDDGAEIEVTGFGRSHGELSIRREGLATGFERRRLSQREIEIGDPPFDDEFYIEGPAPLAFAVLVPRTRRLLATLLQGRIRVERGPEIDVDASLRLGRLVVRMREGRLSKHRTQLAEILAEVLEVARLLVPPNDLGLRIAANVRSEEQAGVRLRALRVLAREFPQHSATRPTLLAGCKDESAEIRLAAATAIGAEAHATLLDLARDAATTDAVAARAVSALGEALPLDLAGAILKGVLGEAAAAPERQETAIACLESLGRLARAEAEGLVIATLHSPDPELKVGAVRALGRLGTAAAVPALREQMARHGELLHSKGRQAIAAIQSRLSGAAAGQLSLAASQTGALSLASAESGELSLADPEEKEEKGASPR